MIMGNLDVSTTMLHPCSVHILIKICLNSVKKFKRDRQMKRLVLHVFGRVVNCKHMDEMYLLFELLCCILCSKKQTSACFDKLAIFMLVVVTRYLC